MEIRTVINLLLGRKPAEKQADKPSEPACRHLALIEFSEGVRFCRSCKTIERFQRIEDEVTGLRTWGWKVIPPAEALPMLKEIQTRVQGKDEASIGKKAA